MRLRLSLISLVEEVQERDVDGGGEEFYLVKS